MWCQQVRGLSVHEGRDEVHSSNDHLGIEEAKCTQIIAVIESNARKTFRGPGGGCIHTPYQPMNPQNVHSPNPSLIVHIHMKNTNDPCIPVGMEVFAFFLMCEHHDVSMRVWVEGVLIAAQVVVITGI